MQYDKNLVNLGKHIKKLRTERKLTLRMLCYNKGLGLEPSTISRIEKGMVEPKYLTLLHLAEAFGIKLSELLNF